MSDPGEEIRVRVDDDIKTFDDHDRSWVTDAGLLRIQVGRRTYSYPVQNIVEIVEVVGNNE